MDMNTKAKQAVLEELMQLMDSKMTEGLKSKSPKFGVAKVSIDSTDPKMADDIKSKLMGEDSEEMSESPEEMLKEKMDPMAEDNEVKDQSEDEDMEKLMDLYRQLK